MTTSRRGRRDDDEGDNDEGDNDGEEAGTSAMDAGIEVLDVDGAETSTSGSETSDGDAGVWNAAKQERLEAAQAALATARREAAELAGAYRDAGADLAIMNLPLTADPGILAPLAKALAPLAA